MIIIIEENLFFDIKKCWSFIESIKICVDIPNSIFTLRQLHIHIMFMQSRMNSTIEYCNLLNRNCAVQAIVSNSWMPFKWPQTETHRLYLYFWKRKERKATKLWNVTYRVPKPKQWVYSSLYTGGVSEEVWWTTTKHSSVLLHTRSATWW